MNFSIALTDLESLLRAAGLTRPRVADVLTLSACAARVFVECKGGVAGVEALVFADGAVTLPAKQFRDVLRTYKSTRFLTLEADAAGLRIGGFRMPVLAYDAAPKPPGQFQVFAASVHPPSGFVSDALRNS